jgi:GNAT superfamily N-acetyltransferase
MPVRSLPGTAVRLRRGRRDDLPRLRPVLGTAAATRLERGFRRLVADLGSDLYVAEDAEGEVLAVTFVVYARSLARHGPSALLDGARLRDGADPAVLDGLVALAEERARRRGCRRLAAWVDADDGVLRAALHARGYRPGELLVAELAPA